MSKPFDVGVLLDMLSYCRPARSATTLEFIQRFIAPLPDARPDAFGNWHVRVGDSPILWSCHTDTVHKIGGRQTVHYNRATGVVHLSKRSLHQSACLGADDTSGVFLCHQMIRAGVPGHYVFHYAEEIGGLGSDDIAKHAPHLVADATFAIALDRRGDQDVITHQFGRCCSDAFAVSLAAQLNIAGLDYVPSSQGIFTDTANYTSMIRECTNLSVGYDNAHSPAEYQDVVFLERLFHALCRVDPSKLVAERNTDDVDDWLSVDTFDWPGYFERRSVDTPIYLEDCIYCGDPYEESTSTALAEPDRFCSEQCESDYFDFLSRERRDSVVYLDDEIRAASKRLRDIH